MEDIHRIVEKHSRFQKSTHFFLKRSEKFNGAQGVMFFALLQVIDRNVEGILKVWGSGVIIRLCSQNSQVE